MNLRRILADTREILRGGNIDDASLEGEILLRHVLGTDRAGLFSHLDSDITPGKEAMLRQLVERRLKGEPVAYLTGHREFYGLDFVIDRNVLVPRPETELLVEKAIEFAAGHQVKTVADIGTGSGALAVSIAVNLPEVMVYAVDLSVPALEIAAANCRRHGVADRVSFLHGDLLEPLQEQVDIIMANLPYVRTADLKAQRELEFEPVVALDGGDDGLRVFKKLVYQVEQKLATGGCLFMEIGQGQVSQLTDLIKKSIPGAVTEIFFDLAGIERVMSLSLT